MTDPTPPRDFTGRSGHLLVDVMCGGIVPYLRMCGYDVSDAGDRDLEADEELLRVATTEERTVITRDVQLAGRAPDAILLESLAVEGQLRELHEAGLALFLADEPIRCGTCNGVLDRVNPTESTPEGVPDPAETDCWRCVDCGQHFWMGSHWDRVRDTLQSVREDTRDRDSG